MSKLFLHIQLAAELRNINFHKPIITIVRENIEAVQIFDFDNFSDSSILNYANELLKKSDQIVIYFEAEPQANMNYLRSFLTNLLDKSEVIPILLSGNNEPLEKILSILSYQKISENTQEIELIETIHSMFLLNI
jgi:hypothetical protein